jgi:subtilisin family serine protease
LIEANGVLDGRLSWSDALNPNRPQRYADTYIVSGLQSGQTLHIDLQSQSFDPFLQVINLDTGKVLYENDDVSRSNRNSRISFTVQADTTYQLRITSYAKYETGRYQLTLKSPDGASGGGSSVGNFNFRYGYGLVDAAGATAHALGSNLFGEVPNLGGKDWALDQIKAPEVWAQGYTGQDVVVAVLDTGVDYNHPDLVGNIWQNPGEIAGNGIDDDGNGYVDDIHGWKFVDTDSNNPIDKDGHGTHVAGTIAGLNNGFGVTGVAYNAKIMPVKVIDGDDDASFRKFDANVADGIRYAVENGADVISMSLGNYPDDPTMTRTKSALEAARQAGVVVVMASGNERISHGASKPIEPAYFALDHLGIAVGAVNKNRKVAGFSNPAGSNELTYVSAPGVNIYSSVKNGQYDTYSGTSMAAPHVAGVVALMLSADPTLTPSEIEASLTASASQNLFV